MLFQLLFIRQSYLGSNRCRRFITAETFIPVSYTHLDVYKRQPINSGSRSPAAFTLSIILGMPLPQCSIKFI